MSMLCLRTEMISEGTKRDVGYRFLSDTHHLIARLAGGFLLFFPLRLKPKWNLKNLFKGPEDERGLCLGRCQM